jgi:heme-degrading monooxygenase HmoA
MIVRIWRATIDIDRSEEYERFASAQSLPMFHQQEGFLGVVFGRHHAEVAVISFWSGHEALVALQRSASYLSTIRRIEATGFLVGKTSTEVWNVHGGVLPGAEDIRRQIG